jgi:hypothetical protein
MTSIQKNFVESNKEYAAKFTQGDLALPPSQKYAICMSGPPGVLPESHPNLL